MRRPLALLAAAALLAALLLALFFEARSVGAQRPAPVPLPPVGWTFGGYSAEARRTWWTKPGDRVQRVFVEGGARAEVFCQGGLCVLNAHGVRVYADGLVAERYGVFVPIVAP